MGIVTSSGWLATRTQLSPGLGCHQDSAVSRTRLSPGLGCLQDSAVFRTRLSPGLGCLQDSAVSRTPGLLLSSGLPDSFCHQDSRTFPPPPVFCCIFPYSLILCYSYKFDIHPLVLKQIILCNDGYRVLVKEVPSYTIPFFMKKN